MDIPAFKDETEEAEFWATHAIAGELLDEMKPISVLDPELAVLRLDSGARTHPISVRLDRDVLNRLKALATKKHKGYQSLLKEFVVERLYEEEKREGLIA